MTLGEWTKLTLTPIKVCHPPRSSCQPIPDLVSGIIGKLSGEDYNYRKLFEQLFEEGLQLITALCSGCLMSYISTINCLLNALYIMQFRFRKLSFSVALVVFKFYQSL